jgi:hypothetical protein
MWAALTEMHSMLWLYEALAFRGLQRPRKLSPENRDKFIAEVAEYCKLFPAAEENLPYSMADLNALYERDAHPFGDSDTMSIIPATGQNFPKIAKESIKKNNHPSQVRVLVQMFIQNKLFELPVLGSVSGKTRRSMGLSKRKERMAVASTKVLLPLIWLVQQPPIERHFMRLMWGPDAVKLITSARKLHAEALKSGSGH